MNIKAPFDCGSKPKLLEQGLWFAGGLMYYCHIDWLVVNYRIVGGITALRLNDMPFCYEMIFKDDFDFENSQHREMGNDLFIWEKLNKQIGVIN